MKTVIEYNDFSFLTLNDQISIFSLILDNAILSKVKLDKNNRNIILKVFKKEKEIIINVIYSMNCDTNNQTELLEKISMMLSNYNVIISSNINDINQIIIINEVGYMRYNRFYVYKGTILTKINL